VLFVIADQLELQRALYYAIYGLAVVGLFIGWARDTGQSLRGMCARRWRLARGSHARYETDLFLPPH
jgi:hypothetical protein